MAHVTLFPMLNILYADIGTFRRMLSVSILAIFYSSLMSYFPGMLCRHLWNDAPIITGITFVFTFHVCSLSVAISIWFIITMLIHLCFSFSFWLCIPIHIWTPLTIGANLLFKQTVSCLLFYSTNPWMHNSVSCVTLIDQLLQSFSTHKTSSSGTPTYNYLSASEMDIHTVKSLKYNIALL